MYNFVKTLKYDKKSKIKKKNDSYADSHVLSTIFIVLPF